MRKGQQKPREPTKLRLVFVQLVQKTNGSSVTNFVGISQVLWGKQWKASRTNKFEHILDRKKASKLCLNVAWKYCWWKKSCTSWHILDLVINEIGYLSTSAGFLPSTVGLKKDNILAIIEPQAFGWKEPAVTSHREHVTRESIVFCLLIILSMATRNPANQLRLAVDPIIHTGFIYIYMPVVVGVGISSDHQQYHWLDLFTFNKPFTSQPHPQRAGTPQWQIRPWKKNGAY